MNRAERRAKEKEKKKETNKKVEAMAWLKSLPPAKQVLIDSLVKIEAKKENGALIQAIDRCFSAAIIQEFENLEWADIERIIDTSAELMMNDAEKMKKLKESFGGSYDMAMKKIDKMGPEVEKRIREIINDGYNQKVSIKMLQEEFRDLSTAMLTNAFKKTKAIIKDEQKAKDVVNKIKDIMGEPDKEIEDALDYIFEDEIADQEVVKEEPKQEVEFEVVKEIRIVDLRGKFGEYHVEKNVVSVKDGDLAFSNSGEVKDWASKEREVIAKEIETLKSKMRNITDRENETIKVIEQFM
jgi:hypothetical protein